MSQSDAHKTWLLIGISVFLFLQYVSFVRAETVFIDASVPIVCGNTVVELGESCDDGNIVSDDGCSSACTNEPGPDSPNPPPPVPGPAPEPAPVPAPEPAPAPAPAPAPGGGAEGGAPGGQGGGGSGGGGPGGGQQPLGPGVFAGRLNTGDFTFFIGDGIIPSAPINGVIFSFPNDDMLVFLDRATFEKQHIDSLWIIVNGERIPFALRGDLGGWGIQFKSPKSGASPIAIGIRYNDDLVDVLSFRVKSLSYGLILEKGIDEPLPGAIVTLYDAATGRLWPAEQFGQANPQVTGPSGGYGFIVPNGSYKLIIKKEGYREYRTLSFSVNNHLVNRIIEMVKRTGTLDEVYDEGLGLLENAANITKFLGEKAREQLQLLGQTLGEVGRKVQEVADNPEVEKATREVVAPTAVGLSILSTLPSLWGIILPLLRFLFLQPILLVGKRKREAWGMVYNSLTKVPVDLAIVRLIDARTHKVLQSRVTDTSGRYVFVVEPGQYVIEAKKPGFLFPSGVLKTAVTDGTLVDLYHGEPIAAEQEAVTITPNIPLDPEGKIETPRRIIWEKRLRVIQHVISVGGVAVTGVALYITPTWYIGAFLALHVVLYGLFMRYVKPRKPDGWGIVYDMASKRPLGRAIVRLFSKQYNKLIDTELTTKEGKYTFLAGPSDYYVTYEKQGYEKVSKEVKVKEEEGGVIKEKVGLQRRGVAPPTTPPPPPPDEDKNPKK